MGRKSNCREEGGGRGTLSGVSDNNSAPPPVSIAWPHPRHRKQ